MDLAGAEAFSVVTLPCVFRSRATATTISIAQTARTKTTKSVVRNPFFITGLPFNVFGHVLLIDVSA